MMEPLKENPFTLSEGWRVVLTKELHGVIVSFLGRESDKGVAWYAYVGENLYGDWITLEHEKDIQEAIDILTDQADAAIYGLTQAEHGKE